MAIPVKYLLVSLMSENVAINLSAWMILFVNAKQRTSIHV